MVIQTHELIAETAAIRKH